MRTIDYRGVVASEEWASLLVDISHNATESVQAGDRDAMAQVQSQLVTFTQRAPSKVHYLVEIARDLARDLYNAQASASLEAIAQQRISLEHAIAEIEAVTEDNRGAEQRLRLEGLREQLAEVRRLAELGEGGLTQAARAVLLEAIEWARERAEQA